jgi:sortase B
MNFEKQLGRFQKNLKQGKYKMLIRKAGIGTAIVCVVILGRYYIETSRAEEAVAKLREVKEASRETGKGEELKIDNEVVLPEYQTLFSENPDLEGWLTIDGTSVDYPVMWTPEDPEYYSRRGFDKKESKNGLLFMDEASDMSETGGNIIIYGHNMKNGSMFADILKYKDEKYYKEHTMIQLDTLYEARLYEVASVVSDSDLNELPYGFTSASDLEAEEVIGRMKLNSLYDTGVDLSYGDDVLTLSTCDYSVEDGRLVVIARRVQ